jgi:hypothetical protein
MSWTKVFTVLAQALLVIAILWASVVLAFPPLNCQSYSSDCPADPATGGCDPPQGLGYCPGAPAGCHCHTTPRGCKCVECGATCGA